MNQNNAKEWKSGSTKPLTHPHGHPQSRKSRRKAVPLGFQICPQGSCFRRKSTHLFAAVGCKKAPSRKLSLCLGIFLQSKVKFSIQAQNTEEASHLFTYSRAHFSTYTGKEEKNQTPKLRRYLLKCSSKKPDLSCTPVLLGSPKKLIYSAGHTSIE